MNNAIELATIYSRQGAVAIAIVLALVIGIVIGEVLHNYENKNPGRKVGGKPYYVYYDERGLKHTKYVDDAELKTVIQRDETPVHNYPEDNSIGHEERKEVINLAD